MIFAAIDWGEQRHRVILLDEQGRILDRQWFNQEAYDLGHLNACLTSRGDPADVHVAIEMHDSLLLDRLLRLGVKVYGLNPKSAERARERFTPTGVKDDERDAWSLAEFLRTSHQHLRPIRPDSAITVELQEWVSWREDLVQERTAQLQKLHAHLARWHPHILRATKDLNQRWVLAHLGLGFLATPIDASLPILTAVLLLKGSPSARLLALGLTATVMTSYCSSGYTLTWLTQMAIKALLASSIEPFDWYVSPFPLGIPFLNRFFFDAVFVESVTAAGPWLLIAIYAWRVPMRMPADDGSPFPRRYCGHCHYNLRGIESPRCPECGCELVANAS